jgi:hypothetical protein
MALNRGDGDAHYRMTRARLGGASAAGGAGGAGVPGPMGPQGPKGVAWRGAWEDFAAYQVGDLVVRDSLTFICILAHTAATNPPVMGGDARWSEISPGYLATSGARPMAGALDMNHNSISNAHDADIEGTETLGEDLTLTGGAGSANVSGVRRVRLVSTVQAGVDYVAATGDASWDSAEKAPAFFVTGGSAPSKAVVGADLTVYKNGKVSRGGIFFNACSLSAREGYATDPDIQKLIANCITDFSGSGAKTVWLSQHVFNDAGLTTYLAGLGHTLVDGNDGWGPNLNSATHDFAVVWVMNGVPGANADLQCQYLWNMARAGKGVFVFTAWGGVIEAGYAWLKTRTGMGNGDGAAGYPAVLQHMAVEQTDPVFAGITTIGWVPGASEAILPPSAPYSGVSASHFGTGAEWGRRRIFHVWRP